MDARAAVAAAVVDNARWCHLVCSAHGITGRFDADAWVSPRRTPLMYPDAVTLAADVAVGSLLSRIDAEDGCSIKDSFASVDLTAAGFEVLFDAEWIWRDADRPTPEGSLRWKQVTRPDDLRAWADHHGTGRTLSPRLLDEPSVVILAGYGRSDGRRAGAIATVGDGTVGISNVFVADEGPGDEVISFAAAFADATTEIARRCPGRAVVGYLGDDRLEAARLAGYAVVGPLRVWLRGPLVGDTADA
jgi:hypothetical protein